MQYNKIEQALNKIQASAEFYDQLCEEKISTDEQFENTRLKAKYTKEQILKLTLEIREASKEIEKRIERKI